MSRQAAFILLLLAVLTADAVHAQLFSYDREAPRPAQSLAFVASVIDFNYKGSGEPADRFDFEAVAHGAQYVRPNLHVSLLYGTHRPEGAADDETLQLIDASILTWGGIALTADPAASASYFFIPVVLHSSHRRVAVRDDADTAIDAFNVTVIGLGTGLGFSARYGKAHLETRATPIIGIATRSFGDAGGSSTLFDADLMLSLNELIGRFGLSVGYGFRSQRWNVGSSNLLEDVSDDLFDYSGSQHFLRAGFSW